MAAEVPTHEISANLEIDDIQSRPGNPPEVGRFNGFHHCEFYVSNAKQVADWYCLRFGFRKVAYKGLETGSRMFSSWVVRQTDANAEDSSRHVTFVFTSLLNPVMEDPVLPEEIAAKQFAQWIALRGDSVRNIAFSCDNPAGVWEKATSRGATSPAEPRVVEDNHGTVEFAELETYGEVIHTLINDTNYNGCFLPGYNAYDEEDPIYAPFPTVNLHFIDHIVGNQPNGKMLEACNWYQTYMDFHRFWSVDDKQMHTEYSALRSVVMTDWDETIKMPLNEPAPAKRKSQIQEYVEYHGGAGVQHVALNTTNILEAVAALRARGMTFLKIPDAYYDNLRKRLEQWDQDVQEDLAAIQELGILVDFDDRGYLLQLFTTPVEDRPTLFFEIIQRAGNQGFGVGNFKALFEAIERAQEERGNLTAC